MSSGKWGRRDYIMAKHCRVLRRMEDGNMEGE